MKAVDANLRELLKKSTQFVVPIYQRVYSWDTTECEQLWCDVVRAGKTDALGAHFTGSIVYVEKDQGTRTSVEPDLIIDGQQRVTTVTLLLAALEAPSRQAPGGRPGAGRWVCAQEDSRPLPRQRVREWREVLQADPVPDRLTKKR